MRILFMGTPDFALYSLRGLVESGEEIIGVVTQPDQPKGRGYVMTPPPVKVYAEEQGIAVYQPLSLRDDAFFDLLQEFSSFFYFLSQPSSSFFSRSCWAISSPV